MRYKHFKNADVSVSALAVGTWAIGGQNYGPGGRGGLGKGEKRGGGRVIKKKKKKKEKEKKR